MLRWILAPAVSSPNSSRWDAVSGLRRIYAMLQRACRRPAFLNLIADYDPAPATWVAEAAWITVWAEIVERASQP